jgi:thiamine-phosphate pyrophosphorylase
MPEGGLAGLDEVDAAIRGGAGMVQYRVKRALEPIREVTGLLELCRRAGVPLIVNDDVELAAAVGADGVHLGRDDVSLRQARQRLGTKAIIGVSCYNDVQRAALAVAESADYVAFGRFFPSRTKPNAPCADPATLTAAKATLAVPIVAIGGITVDNAAPLLKAGADWLAVIEGVFGGGDPERAARAFSFCQAGCRIG